ncbi:transposase family protein [Frankia sp. R82]|uniref:transposase family protein n=1 Tax=Frankia sp. R82 TaxID=2950553 RepID=UPI0020430A0F|nr:transposase family protein [Frankia sp. R82]MCM3883510.1 transposase family protein [Frankia sp. R82]
MIDPRCRTRSPGSPSVPVLDRLAAVVADGPHQPSLVSSLLAVFCRIPKPRRSRDQRHSLAVVPAPATCTMLAGARSFTAIVQWAADAGW